YEGGTCAELARDTYFAAHRVQRLAHDPQAETKMRPARLLLGLERLEDTLKLLGRYTNPAVAHFDPCHRVVGLRHHFDWLPAGKADCIVEQVGEHLLHAGVVPHAEYRF